MSKNSVTDLTVNWNRAIFIDEPFNDQLVRRLTPSILKLRQESSDPITVAIDSAGGSLSSLDTLLGLLTGPTQDGVRGSIVTVATNRAYSAAATFLAFGDYSVALSHSRILFHDVRFGEIEDVTPAKARDIAKSLQDQNDRFALRLANQIIRRLVWVFIDQRAEFLEARKAFPRTIGKYKSQLGKFAMPVAGQHFVDIASFATTLFSKLSKDNEALIDGVMERLGKWVILTGVAESFPTYRSKGSRRHGLLDGARQLHKELSDKSDSFTSSEVELKLLLTLLVAELSNTTRPFIQYLDEANRNFILIQSMNEEKHKRSATRLMLRHEVIFFNKSIKELSEEDQRKELDSAMPYAQLFWLFCVSLCRELFEGEHILSPTEGQLLGLIDEVAGGGEVQSRREFRVQRAKEEAAAEPQSSGLGLATDPSKEPAPTN